MTPPDAELHAIVDMLEDADLIEPYVNEDGKDALAVLAALIDEQR